jgi:glycosyltransferase involved in cell wall biosynthesis
MKKLVTIGIPIYKRLELLPNVLKVVAAQDYPHIDLLVSDNGLNGSAVPDIVNSNFPRPYRFRQNAATVGISAHFTQLMRNAEGEYFVVLADDDEISPNFVSELVVLLERYPRAVAAFGREETIDQSGHVLRASKETVPEVLSDAEFIRATWGKREYGIESLCTFLAQTERLLACGGFPEIFAGTSDEDLLMVKLCLGNQVAFSTRCSFRKRMDERSMGYALETKDLARGIREFVAKMDADPQILAYAGTHPEEWKELRGYLFDSAWDTYWFRWADLYRRRLPSLQWARAGFVLPMSYHPRVARFLLGACRAAMFAPSAGAAPVGENRA